MQTAFLRFSVAFGFAPSKLNVIELKIDSQYESRQITEKKANKIQKENWMITMLCIFKLLILIASVLYI